MSECWLLKLGGRNNLLQEDHESWIDDKDTAVIKYRIPIQLRVFLPGVSNSDCLDYRHEFGVCGGVGWGGGLRWVCKWEKAIDVWVCVP